MSLWIRYDSVLQFYMKSELCICLRRRQRRVSKTRYSTSSSISRYYCTASEWVYENTAAGLQENKPIIWQIASKFTSGQRHRELLKSRVHLREGDFLLGCTAGRTLNSKDIFCGNQFTFWQLTAATAAFWYMIERGSESILETRPFFATSSHCIKRDLIIGKWVTFY